MAEAAIGSIVEMIIVILGSRAIETVGKLRAVKHELNALETTVSMLQAVLHHVEEQYYQSSKVQECVDKLKDALYDAQDMLEEFNIEAMRRELRGHKKMMKEVRAFAFKLKMNYKVRAARERIDAIKTDMNSYLEGAPKRARERRMEVETHSFILEEDIIGRGDDKEKVIKFLLDSNVNEKENVSILPIVGIGGLGKTALAQCVYNDEMVNKHFHLKMWVCVSNDFDQKKIVTNMVACAKKEAPSNSTMDQLQSELRVAIGGKRYLLVLDDWWNEELEKWRSLKSLLVGGARGSKILITTRLPLVAKITSTASSHFLKDLSDRASLVLLMQMAGRKIDEIEDPDMLTIGEEIVRKCYGVPLVVRTVGSILFLKETKLEWLHFKDYELPDVPQGEEGIKSILKLSYDHLPSYLKQCFAFCSLFPKDYEIKKQTLIDLWLAEGFIQHSNTSQHLEDIAHGYFMDLLWSNFFQDYHKDKETCKMHDLMHDLACLVAGTECRAAWDGTKPIHKRTRHISHGLTSNLMGELPISHLKKSPLRTFLSTAQRHIYRGFLREPSSEAYLHQLIRSFKRLRVLDLHNIYAEKVLKSICKLKYLTYLDLSHNEALKRLPNSITRLQNLQTLNLNSCHALEELPKGIRKLVSLRNLDIDDCPKLCYLPPGLGQLSSLHRLTRFILPKDKALAKDCCKLGELNGLNDIRGSLRIENLGSVTDAKAESNAANLIGKHSLESLALEWGYFNTDDVDEALLGGLKPHSSLQKLEIYGYKGESFPRWMMDSLVSFLPNLVEVCISSCGRCKSFPPLGQLSHLKTLKIWKLTELEYIVSDHPSTSTISFPRLLELDIYSCEKLKAVPPTPRLEELTLTRAHPALINMIYGLNKLKRLVIEDMEYLECVPDECWKSLTSLESLSIQRCPGLTSLSKAAPPPPPLGTRHQSKLVDLDSSDSEELHLSNYDESSGGNNLTLELHSLRSVSLFFLPKLASLPQWLLQASNLERLEIWGCSNLKALPEQIEALQSLRELRIWSCPLLTSLPEGMRRLASLTHLKISNCP